MFWKKFQVKTFIRFFNIFCNLFYYNLIESIYLDNMFSEDLTKLADPKKLTNSNFNLKEIKDNATELVNLYIKKYEKLN